MLLLLLLLLLLLGARQIAPSEPLHLNADSVENAIAKFESKVCTPLGLVIEVSDVIVAGLVTS